MSDLDTGSIVELDRRHLLHPYQGFDTFRTDEVLPITRGSGARLVDNDGREYLDAVGGMWCTNIGLGRDEMADAIAAQVRDLAYANPFVDMTNVPSVQLAGGNAEFAGDEAFQDQPRTFGHVYISSSPESPVLAAAFEAGLAEGGATVIESLPYTLDPGTIQAQASQIIAKLKSSGVTTVVLASDGIAPRDLTNEATAQEYFPEWVIVAPALSDLTAFGRTYDQTQWANAFGVTHGAARVTPEISGFYGLYQWFMGAEPPAKDTIGLLMPNYTFLAANLQATGPNLTPESFRDALFAGAGTTPALTQPLLTYGDKDFWPDTDYNGVDDATLIWWDVEATGPDEIRRDGTGMWTFVDGGQRYLPGEWPTESRLFDPEGAVTIYDAPPEAETPPNYPSPAG